MAEKCYICNSELDNKPILDPSLIIHYKCPTCGKVELTNILAHDSTLSRYNDQLYKISYFSRKRTENNEQPILLHSENIEEIINSFPKLDTLKKVDLFLWYISSKSDFIGKSVLINLIQDYVLIGCINDTELVYIKDYLQQTNLIRYNSSAGNNLNIILTIKGWERVNELKKNNPESNQCFVAMWFDESTNKIYQSIKKAIEADKKYKALRIDFKEHIKFIPDEILLEIRRSKFMVADFTGQRHGVYFEAGFAMGLNIPVIWICQKDEIEKLHFDIKQYNHIDYKDEKDLYERLKRRIGAVIV